MANSDLQSLVARKWRVLYRAAVLDQDNSDTPKKVSVAEEAIVERIRELFPKSGAHAQAEREELDDAMYTLRALRVALQYRTCVA